MKGLALRWVLPQVGQDGSVPGIPAISVLLPSTQKPDLYSSYPNGKGGSKIPFHIGMGLAFFSPRPS